LSARELKEWVIASRKGPPGHIWWWFPMSHNGQWTNGSSLAVRFTTRKAAMTVIDGLRLEDCAPLEVESAPAPVATDSEDGTLSERALLAVRDVAAYLHEAGDSELVFSHVLTLLQQRGFALNVARESAPGVALLGDAEKEKKHG
jgi:hypothetical protein